MPLKPTTSDEDTRAEYLIVVAYEPQFISHRVEVRVSVQWYSGRFSSFRRPVAHIVEKKATKF